MIAGRARSDLPFSGTVVGLRFQAGMSRFTIWAIADLQRFDGQLADSVHQPLPQFSVDSDIRRFPGHAQGNGLLRRALLSGTLFSWSLAISRAITCKAR